jgi:hypothetical protein
MKRKSDTKATVKTAQFGIEAEGALTALRNEHKKVEALFEQFTGSTSRPEKERLIKQVCAELMNQTKLEEEILLESWPANGTQTSANASI